MTITLRQIRDAGPCGRKPASDGTLTGFCKLLDGLGEPLVSPNLNRVLSIGDVALINGLDDALWCLQVLPPRERVAAIMPAVKRASSHTTDQRVHDCIAAIDRWLAGDDTVDLRASAWAAWAAEAAQAAAEAARAAAWAAEAQAAEAARETERAAQLADLLAMFPPVIVKMEVTK